MNIGVIGLGYVGMATSLAFALHRHQVIGVDRQRDKVELLIQGKLPFFERDMQEHLISLQSDGFLSFTDKLSACVCQSDILFLCVGTPTSPDGNADLQDLFRVVQDLQEIWDSCPPLNGCLLVIKSTVPVGTADIVQEMLSRYGVSVASNPEFLREGCALSDALLPSRIVIGTYDSHSRSILETLYLPFQVPKVHTSPREAELIKYASNAFLATKISFVNELARLSERLGTDIVTVAEGMGMDPRIGQSYLGAGIGYGGSCFPKDVQAIIRQAEASGERLGILERVADVNESQIEWVIRQWKRLIPDLRGKRVGVLGLAFKPGTDDLRASPALALVEAFLREGADVTAFDPLAMEAARSILPEVRFARQAIDVCEGAHAVVLATEWEPFLHLDWQTVKKVMASPVLLDGRNAWPKQELLRLGFRYAGVGRGVGQPIDETGKMG